MCMCAPVSNMRPWVARTDSPAGNTMKSGKTDTPPGRYLQTGEPPKRRAGEGEDAAGKQGRASPSPRATSSRGRPDALEGDPTRPGDAAAPLDRAGAGADPAPRGPHPGSFSGWLGRTAASPPQADNRRDPEGNTPLMRAARDADFPQMVDLLGHPGTDFFVRNKAGQGAYDLLRHSSSDHSSPDFLVASQALFLRTMLSLLIREEHFAN